MGALFASCQECSESTVSSLLLNNNTHESKITWSESSILGAPVDFCEVALIHAKAGI